MSIIAVLCLVLFLFFTLGFVAINWLLGGMGGHSLWDSMRDTFPLFFQLGGLLPTIALIAQLIHQRKRNKAIWPLLLPLIMSIGLTSWCIIEMNTMSDSAREFHEKANRRVTEEVLWSSESIQLFEESGVTMKKSRTLGKPGTGPSTQLVNIYNYSPEIQQMKGLYGHPFLVYESGFELLTIIFEVTDKAPPADLKALRVYEFNPDRPSEAKKQVPDLPKVDLAARTITVEIRHPGAFGLFDPAKTRTP